MGQLFHLVSENEQEKLMLAKVDQSFIKTDIATMQLLHGTKFSLTSPVVHSGEPEDDNALASYTADNLLSP